MLIWTHFNTIRNCCANIRKVLEDIRCLKVNIILDYRGNIKFILIYYVHFPTSSVSIFHLNFEILIWENSTEARIYGHFILVGHNKGLPAKRRKLQESDIKVRRSLWRRFEKINPKDYVLVGIGKSRLKFRNYFFKLIPHFHMSSSFVFEIFPEFDIL